MKYLLPLVLFAVACGGSDPFEDSDENEIELVENESEEVLEELAETTEPVEMADMTTDDSTEVFSESDSEIEPAAVLEPGDNTMVDSSEQMSDEMDSTVELTSVGIEPESEETLDSDTPEVLETTRNSLVTGRTFMPNSRSGFQCQTAETRGGQTVCLLPYQYTIPPYYTKTDHHGHSFGCNIGGDTFESFTLVAGGVEYPMFIENENPFGPQEGIADYFCANFVSTPEGNIGRTHVRLSNSWESFNGNSVSIKVCDQGLCDTLILR